MIHQSAQNHYLCGREFPCTIGQVSHTQYRENLAKTIAKVYDPLSGLPSSLYGEKSPPIGVLGDSFGA